jgi:hypothetical protein
MLQQQLRRRMPKAAGARSPCIMGEARAGFPIQPAIPRRNKCIALVVVLPQMSIASDHSSPPDPLRSLPAGARVCRPGFPPGRTMRLAKAHRTIERRIRINQRGGGSGRCSVSNRPDQPNDSCLFTPPSKTRSRSNAISHPAARSASSETKRSGRGEPPPRPEPELRLPIFTRPKFSSRDSVLIIAIAIAQRDREASTQPAKRGSGTPRIARS